MGIVLFCPEAFLCWWSTLRVPKRGALKCAHALALCIPNFYILREQKFVSFACQRGGETRASLAVWHASPSPFFVYFLGLFPLLSFFLFLPILHEPSDRIFFCSASYL